MMMWLFRIFTVLVIAMLNTAHAEFLPPDQAFQFQAESTRTDQAHLTWKIADGYYLYHDQIKVKQGDKSLSLSLPTPKEKDDPNFGITDVHYGKVTTNISTKPNQSYHVQWQGCAESGLCYPVQRMTIQTDADGLLPGQKPAQKKLLEELEAVPSPAASILQSAEKPKKEQEEAENKPADSSTISAEVEPSEGKEKQAPAIENTQELNSLDQASSEVQPNAENASNTTEKIVTTNAEENTKLDWNNDQFFLNLLSSNNLFLNLLVFLVLGVLLAFLPCSLPLIPILSSILVQRHRGYRAGIIAGMFVLGMAFVYAMMGLAVAQLGYNFQRWLQSPVFISIFALLFMIFALNLFGAFQLSLPQGLLQRLDQYQQKQKGGTLIGSLLMGMIAALIVGPCMSAPLAGALLFVSKLNQPLMGASYLFVLGFGVGLPLFVACVFGAQYLPKPGVWMDRLKFAFGFVMLLLAVYFLRPLLPSVIYFSAIGLIFLLMTGYILLKIRPKVSRTVTQILILFLSLATALTGAWYLKQAWSQVHATQANERLTWQKVRTQQELQAALQAVRGKAVIIDVYADWCVACQPIENEVLPRADVQQALTSVQRIKLDITDYHASQDELLKQWQVLGPPTMILLNSDHQELRNLRLTGTFSAEQLIGRLQQLDQGAQP